MIVFKNPIIVPCISCEKCFIEMEKHKSMELVKKPNDTCNKIKTGIEQFKYIMDKTEKKDPKLP